MIDIDKMIQQNQGGYLGPGDYKLKDTFTINKNRGASWSKNGEQRFKNKTDDDIKTGPGKYNLNKQITP